MCNYMGKTQTRMKKLRFYYRIVERCTFSRSTVGNNMVFSTNEIDPEEVKQTLYEVETKSPNFGLKIKRDVDIENPQELDRV